MNANNSWDPMFNTCTKTPSSTPNKWHMPILKHSGCPDYMLMVLNVGWTLIPTPMTVMWGWKEAAREGVNPSKSHGTPQRLLKVVGMQLHCPPYLGYHQFFCVLMSTNVLLCFWILTLVLHTYHRTDYL